MKKVIASLIVLALLAACNFGKIDKAKGQQLVEQLLTDLQQKNYSSLDKYYTASFNESEPRAQKEEKFRQLENTMGTIKSFEFISSTEQQDADRGVNQLELKYKVVCEKVTVRETYHVINDEGDMKIVFQNIENM